ncbi:hypothetical protein [Massilia sp. H6]|uniref:hypothetical protein n=1 Tax=Massilia sp. H6 TaxID=2970464 RepID=UPI002167C649|nr:hypothetical protein [Massilia sp. H6]UVW29861.1 hypothetical protein NRS07_06995 [Massilia sp. H6]
MKIVYKITYPNGNIYVGKDLAYDINYFGSANHAHVAQDFTLEEQLDFTLRKEVLWHSTTASDKEGRSQEPIATLGLMDRVGL